MGGLCSKPQSLAPLRIIRRDSKLNSKKDIQFNAAYFVQENKESFENIYTLDENPIGSGAFAEVYIGKHKRTGDIRAIKVFDKSQISDEEIRSRAVFDEVEILKSLDHPNILKVYEYFEDDKNYYIVMEFCEGGDIFDKIDRCGKVTEKYAAKVMKYLLIGINYLHSKQVVHRDIKPENILITNKASFKDMSIKIIDFNVATIKYDRTLKGVTGTTDYMAPEVFSGVYNERCDIWSCGVVLYLMVSGQLPFPSPSDEEAEKAIKTQKLTFPSPLFDSISPSCKDFLSKLLHKNPRSRPSASEALNHPWLSLCNDTIDKRLVSSTLKRMQSNSTTSKLKEVFTTFIVSQISKSSSLKKFEQIFLAMDSDKNGVITYDELVQIFSLEMKKEQAEQKAAKMLSAVDNDGNGEIQFTEFLRVAVDHETLLSKENLRKAFCYFDKDGSDAIEKEELCEWLNAGGLIPDDIVQELMQEADVNGDGIIDIAEFENLLANKLEIEG